MHPRLGGQANVGDAVIAVEIGDVVPGRQFPGLPHVFDDVETASHGNRLDPAFHRMGQVQQVSREFHLDPQGAAEHFFREDFDFFLRQGPMDRIDFRLTLLARGDEKPHAKPPLRQRVPIQGPSGGIRPPVQGGIQNFRQGLTGGHGKTGPLAVFKQNPRNGAHLATS